MDKKVDGDSRRVNYEDGTSNGWELVGPSNCRRYLTLKATGEEEKETDDPTKFLISVKSKLFESEAFAKLISALTGVLVTEARSLIRRFRPGLDYVQAAGHISGKEMRLDATLCFVDDTDQKISSKEARNGGSVDASDDRDVCQSKADMWQSSLVGGYTSFVAKVRMEGEGGEFFSDNNAQDDFRPYIVYEGGASRQTEKKSEEEEQDDEPFAQAMACNNSLFIALRDEVA
eukprot:753837-Hanusia_phi.AAC.3